MAWHLMTMNDYLGEFPTKRKALAALRRKHLAPRWRRRQLPSGVYEYVILGAPDQYGYRRRHCFYLATAEAARAEGWDVPAATSVPPH